MLYTGGIDGTANDLRGDGEGILEGVSPKNVRKPEKDGDTEDGTDPQSDDGETGTGGPCAFGGTILTSTGTGTSELDLAAGGTDATNIRPDVIPGSNYRIIDFTSISSIKNIQGTEYSGDTIQIRHLMKRLIGIVSPGF